MNLNVKFGFIQSILKYPVYTVRVFMEKAILILKKNIEYIFLLTSSVYREAYFVKRILLHGLVMAFIVWHVSAYAYEVNSSVPVTNLLVPELAQSITISSRLSSLTSCA